MSSVITKRQKREWMHMRFRENEHSVLPTLEGLHSINASTDVGSVRELLTTLERYITQMCWVFMDFHQVFRALKNAKKHLQRKKEDLSLALRLQSKLDEQYNENKQQYPSIVPSTRCQASYLKPSESSHVPRAATRKRKSNYRSENTAKISKTTDLPHRQNDRWEETQGLSRHSTNAADCVSVRPTDLQSLCRRIQRNENEKNCETTGKPFMCARDASSETSRSLSPTVPNQPDTSLVEK